MSGNVKLAMSHVVPDLVLKVLKGQDPLHILGDGSQVRHYTYGGDLARGIRLAMESPGDQRRLQPLDGGVHDRPGAGRGDLAQGPRRRPPVPLRHDAPFEYDVQLRVPDVRKAKEVLGFEATTTLDDDARRGHPVDRGGSGSRPPVTRRWLDDALPRRRFASEATPRSRLAAIVRFLAALDRSGRAGARHRLRPRPLHQERFGARSMGDRHPGRAQRRCPPTSTSSSRRPGARDVAAARHFGTIFMSNYLEHLPVRRRRHRAAAGGGSAC